MNSVFANPGVTGVFIVAIAFAIDAIIGEPPRALHPVAWFGRLVGVFDRDWKRSREVGLLVLGLPVAAGVVVWAIMASMPPILQVLVGGILLSVTLSRRLLIAEARGVVTASETAPGAARDRLPSLVGRDPASLSPAQMRSAAVESTAENLADGLVAPLVAFGIGAIVSLPVAVAAAASIKGINTMDSMLGYRSKQVGTASARLDDLVMAVPARISALLLGAVAMDLDAIRRGKEWSRDPPSPNSGWPMATLAAILEVKLEKPGSYVLNPSAALPEGDIALTGIRIVNRAAIGAFLSVVVWILLLDATGFLGVHHRDLGRILLVHTDMSNSIVGVVTAMTPRIGNRYGQTGGGLLSALVDGGTE